MPLAQLTPEETRTGTREEIAWIYPVGQVAQNLTKE
jgi:hypothetical protein